MISLRCAQRAAAVLAMVGVLTACGVSGPLGDGEAADQPRLRPLSQQPAIPASSPRSRVPSINYELTTPGTGDDLPEDDGLAPRQPREIFERGGASWYGIPFHQRKTANGERFDMGAMTAAHKTLPFNTRVCVRSLVNGREVLVRINDRGPYASGRIIDLSRAAAVSLDMIGMGIKQVSLSIVDREGMRCGGESAAPAELSTVEPGGPRTTGRKKKAVVNPRQRH